MFPFKSLKSTSPPSADSSVPRYEQVSSCHSHRSQTRPTQL
uniref:Uncharacterized protein n=1 Tax=Anguilla anguilla TaxID=7936 RepID=A0A0E9VZM9_ANGAN